MLVLIYRAVMAALLEAFHALPSLQRRRLLEEDAIEDPLLARLLGRPHALGLALSLWNQSLLVLLLSLAWPVRALVPGGGWTLAGATLLYFWGLDLVLPTLLTARDPGAWVVRLFPFYGAVHPLLAPLVTPLARFVERQRAGQDATETKRAQSLSHGEGSHATQGSSGRPVAHLTVEGRRKIIAYRPTQTTSTKCQ